MIIDCVADLHGHYPELEGGHLLIVAGDLTPNDNAIWGFEEWLRNQKYQKKIVIAGNHDNWICKGICLDNRSEYLCDSGTEFAGYKIWGSPWTNWFEGINPHCTAFTGDEALLQEKFALIPSDTHILVTHGPPRGILDKTKRGEHVGSSRLLRLLYERKISPLLHVFGHIHEGYGTVQFEDYPTVFVNCSLMDENYDHIHGATQVVLEKDLTKNKTP